MAPLGSPPGPSSSTLWATASKEWVIQPKPKPGRKPKKDLPPLSDDGSEIDPKGRRVQNRAAQRAFRERKQSQLAELQARIQSYEQGEIERNVALQNIAKRLKEENEVLRNENLLLQTRVAQLEQRKQGPFDQEKGLHKADKKRLRDDSPAINTSHQAPMKKKSRKDSISEQLLPPMIVASSVTHLPSPSSMVSTPDAHETADHMSPLHYDEQTDTDSRGFDTLTRLPPVPKGDDSLSTFTPFSCGFCDNGPICVCREMAAQTTVQQSMSPTEFKMANFDNIQSISTKVIDKHFVQSSIDHIHEGLSILDNLPAYQPPVPLRRRANGVSVNSVFPVRLAPPRPDSSMMEATCSGDPSNCLACADDDFGKAFCAAIGSSSTSGTCSCASGSTPAGGCCGGTSNCIDCPSIPSSLNNETIPPAPDEQSGLIPTNDAWQKIKEHPNVAFADLSLLAEVVASRSKCIGPRLVLSPAPQLTCQEPHPPMSRFVDGENLESRRRTEKSPPPRLVPQEILLECGRRRMTQVHSAGVSEALRMLDAKFSS